MCTWKAQWAPLRHLEDARALRGCSLGVGVGVCGARRVLDEDLVALVEAVDLGCHQTGDGMLTREDPEVGADGSTEADHAREVREDRRSQRSARVVDHCD